MSKKLKKVLGFALPIAANFIPGAGPFAKIALGAAGGALSGGGLKGALMGGLSSAASNALGGGGALSPMDAASKAGSMAGGFLQGTGAGSSIFSPSNLSTIASGVKSYMDADEMEEDALEQQKKAQAAYSPYQQAGATAAGQLSTNLTNGFNPEDLENDPGYQFNREQGLKALDRSAAARGSYYSGAALKEAQDYGQGLADNTYNSAFNRRTTENQQLAGLSGQGLGAASGLSGVYDNIGNIETNNTLAKGNIFGSTLSNALQGSGARQIIGRRADGTPIYAEDLKEQKTSSQYGVL